MVSPMRLAREANAMKAEKYLDELLIWRELAYGFCFYRPEYASAKALPNRAVATLAEHEADDRPAIYSWETLSAPVPRIAFGMLVRKVCFGMASCTTTSA
jgi:hypothetical protein